MPPLDGGDLLDRLVVMRQLVVPTAAGQQLGAPQAVAAQLPHQPPSLHTYQHAYMYPPPQPQPPHPTYPPQYPYPSYPPYPPPHAATESLRSYLAVELLQSGASLGATP